MQKLGSSNTDTQAVNITQICWILNYQTMQVTKNQIVAHKFFFDTQTYRVVQYHGRGDKCPSTDSVRKCVDQTATHCWSVLTTHCSRQWSAQHLLSHISPTFTANSIQWLHKSIQNSSNDAKLCSCATFDNSKCNWQNARGHLINCQKQHCTWYIARFPKY